MAEEVLGHVDPNPPHSLSLTPVGTHTEAGLDWKLFPTKLEGQSVGRSQHHDPQNEEFQYFAIQFLYFLFQFISVLFISTISICCRMNGDMAIRPGIV